MNFKKVFLFTILLSVLAIGSWEVYWKLQGKTPTLQNSKELWAMQRHKVNDLAENEVVLVGSSRLLFDIQLEVWEKQMGKRPVQLAMGGASPLPVFRDIVQNTNFSGTIILGLTPGLFFSSVDPEDSPISGIEETIDFYHHRTFAQRFSYWLSLPLQRNLVLMHQHESMMDGNIDLKSLLDRIDFGKRTGQPDFPFFYEIGKIESDRNTRMLERMVIDTAFSNLIKNAFMFSEQIFENTMPPNKEGTIHYFLEDLKPFQARGGQVILVRCPSSGKYKAIEDRRFPRGEFWEELVTKSGLPSYYFEDFPTLNSLHLPDESHLSATAADTFTMELLKILVKDGQLKP